MENEKLVWGIVLIAFVVMGYFLGESKGWWSLKAKEVTSSQQVIYVTQPGQTPTQTTTPQVIVQQPITGTYPLESVTAKVRNMFTEAGATGALKAYVPGADVANPYVLPVDTITIISGTGTTTTGALISNNNYDWYFENSSNAYYDEKLDGVTVSYNPATGKGALMFKGLGYFSAKPVGTFITYTALPEYTTGWNYNATHAAASRIVYNKAALAGSGWISMDIGNSASNSILKDIVLCFRDADGDMENNEITEITAAFVSGSPAISIPPSLLRYWQDAMGGSGAQCVLIANQLGSSESARWKLTFTVNEDNFAAGEEFELCFDDLGDYLARQYPSRGLKATASCLTIAVE